MPLHYIKREAVMQCIQFYLSAICHGKFSDMLLICHSTYLLYNTCRFLATIIFLSKRLIMKFYEENKAREQLMAALKAKN